MTGGEELRADALVLSPLANCRGIPINYGLNHLEPVDEGLVGSAAAQSSVSHCVFWHANLHESFLPMSIGSDLAEVVGRGRRLRHCQAGDYLSYFTGLRVCSARCVLAGASADRPAMP